MKDLKKVCIIPTGDELREGVVVDTNSPAVMREILVRFPLCSVTRKEPARDDQEAIRHCISAVLKEAYDLIFVMGGTGGGKRYDPSLARDETHDAMIHLFPDAVFREIYGSNGHLLCKLVLAIHRGCSVITLPGPYVEALLVTKVLLENGHLLHKHGSAGLIERIAGKMVENFEGVSIGESCTKMKET